MMFRARPAFWTFIIALLSGCAHAAPKSSVPTAAVGEKGDVVTPPQLISTQMIRFSPTPSRPHGIVQVPIDSMGRAEMIGIMFRGTFSDITRRDITDFVSQASFAPAKRNGIPERGVFTLTIR